MYFQRTDSLQEISLFPRHVQEHIPNMLVVQNVPFNEGATCTMIQLIAKEVIFLLNGAYAQEDRVYAHQAIDTKSIEIKDSDFFDHVLDNHSRLVRRDGGVPSSCWNDLIKIVVDNAKLDATPGGKDEANIDEDEF